MKTSLTSVALFPLLSLALLSSCDRSVSTVSSENGSVAVLPRFAATSVPVASRLEARLSASGQPDSVVNVAYQKGGDLELGSVPNGASFTVSMTGYDSSLSQRVVRWAGSGSGTADDGSATKYVDILTVSGPSVPSLTIGSTVVPQTLPLAGMWYTKNGNDPRLVSKAIKATGDVVIDSACTVRAARDTVIAGDTLWSDTVSWTFTAAGTAPTAHDSTLSGLTLNGTTVSGFVAGTAGAALRVYTDSVAAGVTSATLAATVTDAGSKISGTGTVSLSLTDPNVTTVTVTNANGNTLVYTVNIYHKAVVVPTKKQYKLTVPPPTNGTVTLNPTGGVYDSGVIVTATAAAKTGYVFSGWTGACTGTSTTCTVTMTKDATLGASFTPSAQGKITGDTGSFTDSRDGQSYKYVKIGSQTWMAQNLNYQVDSSWCPNGVASNCATFGRLYQWAAAMGLSSSYNGSTWGGTLPHQGICPSGWHVPSDAEWTKLTDTTLSSSTSGTVLKAHSSLWSTNTGTDSYGFSVLPAGGRSNVGTFISLGGNAYFWSSSEYDASVAWDRLFFGGDAIVDRYGYVKSFGFSLRCLEN